MAEQLNRPGRVALVELAEVKCRNREYCQSGDPQGPARAGLTAGYDRERIAQVR